MTVKTTNDRAAVVDDAYHWRSIDENTPHGSWCNEKLDVTTEIGK